MRCQRSAPRPWFRAACRVFFSLAIASFLPVLALHGAEAASKGTAREIRIGNLLPLTGPSSPAGKQARCAIELATETINASGGIASLKGARMVNVWADTATSPTAGMAAVKKLIDEDKVCLINGAWNSSVTYTTTTFAEEAKIPYVVPVAVRDSITERGLKYTFRLAPKDSWRARDQFRFLEEASRAAKIKITSVAFVYEDGPWGKSMKEQWAGLAEAHGYRIALTEPYSASSADLTATVMKLRNAGSDVILLASFTDDAVLLAKTMHGLGVKAHAIMGSGAGHASKAFIPSGGSSCEYLFDISAWEPDMNKPDIPAVVQRFKIRCTEDLSAETAFSYISVCVVAKALENSGGTDPAKIRAALADLRLCSGKDMAGFDILAQECIAFDRTGQNSTATHVVVQFRTVGNRIERVTVWPPSVARPGFTPVFPMP